MSRDELAVMDGDKCILQLRGVRPFFFFFFDITSHKRYKELSDYDRKNTFDVEGYLEHRLRLRADEEFEVIEVGAAVEDTKNTGDTEGQDSGKGDGAIKNIVYLALAPDRDAVWK